MKFIKFFYAVFFICILFVFVGTAHASTTDGTIDLTYRYAWSENTGWIDFGTTNGNVHVTDTGLSGYALSENIGWINLGNVVNDGEGHLSGYAWSENTGWIKFNPTNGGVVINSSGVFTGSALSENIGWIIFGGNDGVKTDWRPASARVTTNTTTTSNSGASVSSYGSSGSFLGYSYNSVTPSSSTSPENISIASTSINQTNSANVLDSVVGGLSHAIDYITPNFLKSSNSKASTTQANGTENSLALSGGWNFINNSAISNFVLAPLPKQLTDLTDKYPQLGKVFTKLGIATIADLNKLQGTSIAIPTIANLKDLPHEVLVAQAGNGKIGVSSSITLDQSGDVQQKIQTNANTELTLAVRPDAPADAVTGYLIFKKSAPNTVSELPLTSQTASVLSAFASAIGTTTVPVIPNRDLLVQTFAYTDPDKDGVYTAEVKTPAVPGTYEVVTLVTYHDKDLGTKELRLTTVIDPEGYVYYLNSNGDESRISKAVISIYDANTGELWDANSYNQENPQTTDSSGRYSFLVPQGDYYITAERSGYETYKGDTFAVREGSGVHFNIEMKSSSWLSRLNWTTVLLVLLILIISSAFVGYVIHEHLLRKQFNN